ncbi:MAG: FGGY-family carbohydrate kinase [Anaerolineae bacterium]|nr:FGGY-family carbohydrate kinase [Anaerolineae bacterium]
MKDNIATVLGIDASTTGCKAIVWALDGTAVSEGRADLPLHMPQRAWHEQPAIAWWKAVVRAIREATAGCDVSNVAAMCITPQRETFVPVDAHGEPLRPAIVWMDERSREVLPRIADEYGAERIHRESGKPLSGNLTLSKIAWLREHEPEVFANTAHYLDVAGFLVEKLTGNYRTGWGCADPTGLFDMRHHRWNRDLLDYLGIDVAQLPGAHPPGEMLGSVTPEAAQVCGLPSGLPVIASVGDGQAGGLGAGVTKSGLAYLSLGTSVVSGTLTEEYVTDRAFRTMYSALPGVYSLETVLLSGTYIVNWFVNQIASEGESLADYDASLDQTPPGAEGLVLVPYWNSSLTPYWDVDATGIVAGWRGIHTRAHLYRAILEGIAMEQRLHSEHVAAALGTSLKAYHAMGGGTRSDRWCQIIADVTGKKVYRTTSPEAAALGAGIQAAAAVGLYPSIEVAAAAMSRVTQSPFVPEPAAHEFYTRLYGQVYRDLFPALQGSLQRLAAITDSQRA